LARKITGQVGIFAKQLYGQTGFLGDTAHILLSANTE